MLTIDLRHLKQAPIEAEAEVTGDDPLWHGTGVELVEAVTVKVRAEGTTAGSVWLRGSLKGRVRAACRRCLQPLEMDIADDFDLFFDPQASQEDEDLTLYASDPKADELDLRAPLRERFLQAIPAFPLCREECRGLCAHCGAYLNDGACGCGAREPDPRWGPLLASPGNAG